MKESVKKFLQLIVLVFLFGLLVGVNLNTPSNQTFPSNDNEIILFNSLRGGEKYDGNQIRNSNTAFVQPAQGSSAPYNPKSSGEQSINNQDLVEMPPRVGYKTALSGGKKLPDNSGGGSSYPNNQDNEDEFAWKNVKKNPKAWSDYQQSCQDQSKKHKQCDLIEIESKIKEDSRLVRFAEDAGKNQDIQRDLNHLIEQLRLGNKSPGTGTITLFKGIKESRARSGARVYFREKNGKIEILAKSSKNSKDQNNVIKILRKKYK